MLNLPQKVTMSNNRFVKYTYSDSCANGKLEERNDYYPFGCLMGKGLNGDFQSYKYNGKELERQIGLDIYDYGARRYDAAICRFTTMDPLAEKYYSTSPYAYCVNNPMRYVDLDGKVVVIANGSSESFKNSFIEAIKYLNEKGCGYLYNYLNSVNEVYIIKETMETYNSFDYLTKIIEWNPNNGLDTFYTILSPVSRLNHEFAHAVNFQKNSDEYKENIKQLPEGHVHEYYDSIEEKNVITGSEVKTAVALGEISNDEITRDGHYGNPIKTINPISNKPKEEVKNVIIYGNKKKSL